MLAHKAPAAIELRRLRGAAKRGVMA